MDPYANTSSETLPETLVDQEMQQGILFDTSKVMLWSWIPSVNSTKANINMNLPVQVSTAQMKSIYERNLALGLLISNKQ